MQGCLAVFFVTVRKQLGRSRGPCVGHWNQTVDAALTLKGMWGGLPCWSRPLANTGAWIQSLVREDFTCHEASKPLPHNS